jgi:hypothetical protein
MIDTLLNLLFRCPHKRLTRPVTPVAKAGGTQGATYVACLDCGKKFAYDPKEMRIGKPLVDGQESGIIVPDKPKRSKLSYAFWASLPLVILIRSVWKSKSKPRGRKLT